MKFTNKVYHNIRAARIGLAVAGVMILAGCTDEIMPGGEDGLQSEDGPEVYFSVQFKPATQTGSRAVDFPAEGIETGIDIENKINNVRMIIVEKVRDEDSFYTDGSNNIQYRTVAYSDITKSSDIVKQEGQSEDKKNTWTITGTFIQEELKDYFTNKSGSNPDLYVVLAANYMSCSNMPSPVVDGDIQAHIKVGDNDLSRLYLSGNIPEGNTDFLMLSKEPYKITALTAGTVDSSTDKSNPTLLTGTTPIEVQRLAARIDIDYTHLRFAFPAELPENKTESSFAQYWIAPDDGQETDTELKYTEFPVPQNTAYVLQIEDIALINMSKDYYLYQMASDETNGWQIFGKETTENYFADPLSAQKISTADGNQFFQPLNSIKGEEGVYNNFSNSFTFLPVNSFASPAARAKRDILNKTTVVDNKDYAIFHYTLPNSVHDKTKQFKKNGTAVIFKARITDGNVVVEGKDPIIRNAEESGEDIYAIGNKIFGTLDYFTPKENTSESDEDYGIYKNLFDSFVNEIDVMIIHLDEEINVLTEQLGRETDENKKDKLEAEKAELVAEKTYYTEILNNYLTTPSETTEVDGETETESVRNNKYTCRLTELFNDNTIDEANKPYLTHLKELWDGNFKIYKAENIAPAGQDPEWAYYCYYFYWIRHNNNSKGSVMGPMEFAIVRNHIYKLSIKGIYELGYPDDPGDDPDPLDPNDEIESAKTRIDVQTTLLPWGLRKDQGAIIN